MFLGKGVLEICSKFTGEYPCQSVISIKLLRNFIKITLRHGCSLYICCMFSENLFLGTSLDGCFWLDEIYSKKANGVSIRSKCDWYKSNEKSSKFFLNLEKTRVSQGQIVKNENEINDPVELNTELQEFYKKLLTENLSNFKTKYSLSFKKFASTKTPERTS